MSGTAVREFFPGRGPAGTKALRRVVFVRKSKEPVREGGEQELGLVSWAEP